MWNFLADPLFRFINEFKRGGWASNSAAFDFTGLSAVNRALNRPLGIVYPSEAGPEGFRRTENFFSLQDAERYHTDVKGDDVYVMISEAESRAREKLRFEAHRRYIDIQLVVRGQEAIGIAPVSALTTVEPYDPAKDIEFFAVPREAVTVELHAGDFAVFAPGDGHRPSLHLDGPHVSRKAVVKVSVAYRDRQRDAPPPA